MYESIIKCELKINEEGLLVNFKMAFECLSMTSGFSFSSVREDKHVYIVCEESFYCEMKKCLILVC